MSQSVHLVTSADLEITNLRMECFLFYKHSFDPNYCLYRQIYSVFFPLVSIRCMVSPDYFLNNLQTTLNLKLTLTAAAKPATERSGAACTPADLPADIFPMPPLTLQNKHKSALQLSTTVPWALLVPAIIQCTTACTAQLRSTITFFFAAIIRFEQRANWDLLHCRTINLVWVELSGSKCVCRTYNTVFKGLNKVSLPCSNISWHAVWNEHFVCSYLTALWR